jgi:hypothetical protein
VDSLAPLLASLYTNWHASGDLPASFVQASVYCIPKKSAPESGLDYRPIALLNTDYKVYARLLLQRVRSTVPQLVSATQYGFVPSRQVHDLIDIWEAFQTLAARGSIAQSALAVLLDFAKAYDTLDRRFLTLALQRHGFTPTLVRAVEVMHLGTTAAYVADGQTSAVESVVNGIRQGCPFAPTLFILAVDVLYDMVRANPLLPGLPLAEALTVKVVGFADDTKVYVNDAQEATELATVLDTFAAVSGLVVNKSKSLAIRLSARSYTAEVNVAGFPLAPVNQLVRYLGAQISTLPRPAVYGTWCSNSYGRGFILQRSKPRISSSGSKSVALSSCPRSSMSRGTHGPAPKISNVSNALWTTTLGMVVSLTTASCTGRG